MAVGFNVSRSQSHYEDRVYFLPVKVTLVPTFGFVELRLVDSTCRRWNLQSKISHGKMGSFMKQLLSQDRHSDCPKQCQGSKQSAFKRGLQEIQAKLCLYFQVYITNKCHKQAHMAVLFLRSKIITLFCIANNLKRHTSTNQTLPPFVKITQSYIFM